MDLQIYIYLCKCIREKVDKKEILALIDINSFYYYIKSSYLIPPHKKKVFFKLLGIKDKENLLLKNKDIGKINEEYYYQANKDYVARRWRSYFK